MGHKCRNSRAIHTVSQTDRRQIRVQIILTKCWIASQHDDDDNEEGRNIWYRNAFFPARDLRVRNRCYIFFVFNINLLKILCCCCCWRWCDQKAKNCWTCEQVLVKIGWHVHTNIFPDGSLVQFQSCASNEWNALWKK